MLRTCTGLHTGVKKMIERYREEKAGKLILLGDILYHGPRNDLPRDYAPKKVIEMLNGMKEELLCIRGNCDCDVDQMVLQFPIMAEYAALWLDDRMVWATHGHVFNMDNHPPFKTGDILLHGHTHIPAAQPFGEGFYYINPRLGVHPEKRQQKQLSHLAGQHLHPQVGGGRLDHQQLHHRIKQKRRTEAGTSFFNKGADRKERFLSSGNSSFEVLFFNQFADGSRSAAGSVGLVGVHVHGSVAAFADAYFYIVKDEAAVWGRNLDHDDLAVGNVCFFCFSSADVQVTFCSDNAFGQFNLTGRTNQFARSAASRSPDSLTGALSPRLLASVAESST